MTNKTETLTNEEIKTFANALFANVETFENVKLDNGRFRIFAITKSGERLLLKNEGTKPAKLVQVYDFEINGNSKVKYAPGSFCTFAQSIPSHYRDAHIKTLTPAPVKEAPTASEVEEVIEAETKVELNQVQKKLVEDLVLTARLAEIKFKEKNYSISALWAKDALGTAKKLGLTEIDSLETTLSCAESLAKYEEK